MQIFVKKHFFILLSLIKQTVYLKKRKKKEKKKEGKENSLQFWHYTS